MNYSKILKSNTKLIVTIVLILVILVLAITAVQPFKYRATARLLVIQKQTAIDAYTAAKSGERIAKNLSEIVATSSFYDNVIDSSPNLKNEFSTNEIERRKEWQKDVEAVAYAESGILEISAYHTNPDYASQIVRSIAYVLVNKGGDYHGGGRDVEIKIVDNVLVSKYPVRPNVILNLALAILAGLVIGMVYSIIREARKVQKQLVLKLDTKINQVEIVSPKTVEAPKEDKQFIIVPELKAQPETIKITTFYDHLEKVA